MLGDWKKESNLLFKDDRDRFRFLDRLGERVEQFEIRLYLWTLMANHVHLVLETPQGNLSRFMHSLSTAYTVYFNRRHRRHGHLLDGRFKARLVEGDAYLLKLTRYVHLNPVHTKAMKREPMAERMNYLRRYPWSSYPGYIGRRKPWEFVASAPILALMNCPSKERPTRYRRYVESGLAEDDEEFAQAMNASPLAIGSEDFRERILGLYRQLTRKRSKPEDVSFRKLIQPLNAREVLETLAKAFGVEVEAFRERRRDSPLRGVAARMLCRYAGLSQREAAEELCIGSGSAVSRQLAMLNSRLEKDRRLKKVVRDTEGELENRRQSSQQV
jgi:REP element-mobilizing transposase RayT